MEFIQGKRLSTTLIYQDMKGNMRRSWVDKVLERGVLHEGKNTTICKREEEGRRERAVENEHRAYRPGASYRPCRRPAQSGLPTRWPANGLLPSKPLGRAGSGPEKQSRANKAKEAGRAGDAGRAGEPWKAGDAWKAGEARATSNKAFMSLSIILGSWLTLGPPRRWGPYLQRGGLFMILSISPTVMRMTRTWILVTWIFIITKILVNLRMRDMVRKERMSRQFY